MEDLLGESIVTRKKRAAGISQSKKQKRGPSRLTFKQWLRRLEIYISAEKHASVPKDFVDGEGYHLGLWVGRMRRAHKENTLLQDEKRELDNLGFIWQMRKGRSHSRTTADAAATATATNDFSEQE